MSSRRRVPIFERGDTSQVKLKYTNGTTALVSVPKASLMETYLIKCKRQYFVFVGAEIDRNATSKAVLVFQESDPVEVA